MWALQLKLLLYLSCETKTSSDWIILDQNRDARLHKNELKKQQNSLKMNKAFTIVKVK